MHRHHLKSLSLSLSRLMYTHDQKHAKSTTINNQNEFSNYHSHSCILRDWNISWPQQEKLYAPFRIINNSRSVKTKSHLQYLSECVDQSNYMSAILLNWAKFFRISFVLNRLWLLVWKPFLCEMIAMFFFLLSHAIFFALRIFLKNLCGATEIKLFLSTMQRANLSSDGEKDRPKTELRQLQRCAVRVMWFESRCLDALLECFCLNILSVDKNRKSLAWRKFMRFYPLNVHTTANGMSVHAPIPFI